MTSAMCAVGAAQKQSGKKTSLSESELRTLAKASPDEKNAGKLYSVAMATSDNEDRQQEYLKASAACLIACGKKDIYKKYVKGKLLNAVEFESELEGDCNQCSGSGTKERRCSVCMGKGQCPTCNGSGQTVSVGFDRRDGRKQCRKCNGSGQCHKCGGGGSTTEKCSTCAGTGKVLDKTVAARIFHDSCNSIADGMKVAVSSNDANVNPEVKVNHKERSIERQDATKKASSAKKINAEELFAKRCKADGDMALVSYPDGVNYTIVENTHGDENFVVVAYYLDTSDKFASFMIFPTCDSRDRWYKSVVKCTEKLKSWIRISVENKVKHVSKEIPIDDEVYAYANTITRGRGQGDLLRKAIREPIPQLSESLVKFIGGVDAVDDTFKRYRISIKVICGDFFSNLIFYEYGTIEKIDNKLAELLIFANPESLEKARKEQSKKEDLFR